MLPSGNILAVGDAMWHLLDILFTGSTLPGTILLGVCVAYWLMLIAGSVDLNLIDFDLDADVEADSGGGSWGMTAFRFLNINDVPLMIWLTIFAVGYVVTSAFLSSGREMAGNYEAIAATAACSAAIALVATKLMTQPLRGKFEAIEPNVAQTLVGRACVVTTLEVSERFGQARVESNGAPLLLNVRGADSHLTKNDVAVITGYDSDRCVFYVQPLPPQSDPSRPPWEDGIGIPSSESLVGRICDVESEVTNESGSASIEALGGLLMMLEVRSNAGPIKRPTRLRILSFDSDRRVFLVEPLSTAPSEPPQREAV